MEKICHYTTANNALKILSSNALKFGQIKNSNDPFENLVKRYNLTYRIQDPLKSFMNEIFEFVNTEVSIVCFGVNDNLVLADQNWTMWAHYGETHSGVCLTFDLEAFLNEVQKQSYQLLSGRINYTNSLIIPPDYFDERMNNSLKDILIEFQKPLLFSKHRGWSYENEYRIIVFNKFIKVPINNCLQQVLFGPEIKKYYQTRLENILKTHEFNAKSGKLEYSAGGYAKPSNFFFSDLKEIDK